MGERIVSSSLQRGTTICKTQAPLVTTFLLCEKSQFLVVETKIDAPREEKRGTQVGSCYTQVLGYNSSWNPGTFCLAQVLVVQISFNSVRCIQYYSYKFPTCLSQFYYDLHQLWSKSSSLKQMTSLKQIFSVNSLNEHFWSSYLSQSFQRKQCSIEPCSCSLWAYITVEGIRMIITTFVIQPPQCFKHSLWVCWIFHIHDCI